MPDRPNILILLSDQHGAPFSGCYGHPQVRTPNIDRLARQGVRFDRAYCPSPLCVPSRMAFMTGRRIRNIEIWDNNTRLPSATTTLGHRLEAAGYEAVLCGRMHFNGNDKLHGFRAQLAADPDANESIPDWTNADGLKAHSLSLDTMRKRAKVGEGVALDDQTADAAAEFIRNRTSAQPPWAMVVGFIHPHGPWNAEQRYWDCCHRDRIDLPPLLTEADRHPMHERNRRLRRMPEEGCPDDLVRQLRAGYYAVISRMDEKVGSLLQVLETSGQRDNTIVVYISDHGEMLGQHGLWMKSCLFDASIRVPMIVADPRCERREASVDANVSLIDLAATICDWAGADSAGMDGRSFAGLLRGDSPDWDNRALVEYYATWTDRPMAALIRDSMKLIFSLDDPPQLFDLASDPGETSDLSGDPEYFPIRDRLMNELMHEWNPETLKQRVIASQQARLRQEE